MNYIRHLNAFFSVVRTDNRLTASHVSLYLALFQYWNFNRFQNPFPVYRDNMMQLSKIGSKNTYHKCIRELHQAKYIYYQPPATKFQPVKISMVRLDIKEEEIARYRQLDLFEKNDNSSSPKIETGSVPNLTGTSIDFDTGTVPNLGQNIKPNFKKENVLHPPTKNFKKNGREEQQNISPSGVPNLGHNKFPSPQGEGLGVRPTLSEVEEFFQENKYPIPEAQKFFYYNQGKGWMLTDKIPITNWQSIAHKWMLNFNKAGNDPSPAIDIGKEIQYLQDRYQEGEHILKFIQPDHFDYLKLQLTEGILQETWRERISQLTGINHYSITQLLQGYLSGNNQNELVLKDQPAFIILAKRLAVLNHFKKIK